MATGYRNAAWRGSTVRSWFALGAPLELLSPLAVAVVALVAAVTWLPAVVGEHGWRAGVPTAVVTVVAAVWLLRSRALSHPGCVAVAFGGSACAVLMASSRSATSTVVLLAVPALLAVFSGLFLPFRTMAFHQLASTGLLVTALGFSRGVDGAVDGLVAGVVCLVSAFTVAVTTRAARWSS